MAKATAYCKCINCGEEFIRIKTCYNRTEANNWEEYAEKNFDLCGKCYHEEQDKFEKEKGLYVDIRLGSTGIINNIDFPIAIIFGGDTMPNKENIKSIDAKWTNQYPSDGVLGDLFGMGRPTSRKWVLWCKPEELQEKIELVKSIGARINSMPTSVDMEMYKQLKKDSDSIKKEKEAALENELASIGEIPKWPEEISSLWPKGSTWNCKFYGRPGKWSVYFSEKYTELTDDQKKAMEKVYSERMEWKKKKEAIEKNFK